MVGIRMGAIALGFVGFVTGISVVNGQAPESVSLPPAAAPAPPVVTATTAPEAAPFAALIEAAKGAFVPQTKGDLERARGELQTAIEALDARLQLAGPEAADWRTYLKWDELKGQFARPEGPDLTVLDTIYARFAAGYDGLELVWFEKVRDALRQYLNTARAIDNKELPDQYRKLLDELAKHLETYLRQPSAEEASAIATAIDWLQSAGQAKELVAAIRAQLVRPNIYAQASRELVAAAIVRCVDEIQPVEDCILGVAITGTGRTRGQTNVELVPNLERAQIDIVFSGQVDSNTVGFAERNVQVYATGLTWITARKPIFIESEQIWSMPSTAGAQTKTSICDIEAQRWLVERIAWRRALRQQPLADSIAADHAAQRASAQANGQGDPQVADANQRYQSQIRKPLYDRNIYPQQLQFSSTANAVHLIGLQAGTADLGALNPPPAVAEPLDLAVQFHESSVNNSAEGLLGGAVMTEKRFQDNLTQLLGNVPDSFKSGSDEEPWTITFARRQPISVNFMANNQFSVTVRGRSYARDEETYPGMNVTATYRLEPRPAGITAVRQGELEIFPPGFQPGAGKQLSVRQQVLRDLLKRRFDKMFDKEIRPKDIELRSQQDQGGTDIGALTLVGWEVGNGWMTTTWKRLAPAPVTVTQSVEPQPLDAGQPMPAGGVVFQAN